MRSRLRTTGALVLPALCLALSGSAAGAPDEVWLGGLRTAFFAERPIVESDDVIVLEAPVRAENAAIVPIRIRAAFAQSAERYIRKISLIIDRNPAPLAGVFEFTPHSGRADLAMRIRVNEYTPVRAVAETNDGALHMSSRFVKASGGCSAPVGTDLDAAMQRLGKMKMRVLAPGGATSLREEPLLAQLAISHPNITGLQMDQLTRMYHPAHFVRSVAVSYNGKPVFSAETDISISENPNFRFYFVPDGAGELSAEVVDTEGRRFTRTFPVAATRVAASQ